MQIIAFRIARGDTLHHPSEIGVSGIVISIQKDEGGELLYFTVQLQSGTQAETGTQIWAFAANAVLTISEQTGLTEQTEAQPLTKLDVLQEADLHTILIDFSEADLD